jgi:hypothetical protein
MMRGQFYRCAVSGLPFDLTWNTGRNLFRNPFGPPQPVEDRQQ